MNINIENLIKTGVIVPIEISPITSSITNNKDHVVNIKALLDTGASITVIDKQIINELDLTPLGESEKGFITTASDVIEANRYIINISFLGDYSYLSKRTMKAAGFEIKNTEYFQAVIGRDLLSYWLLTWDGRKKLIKIEE